MKWRDAHRYSRLGNRLGGMLTALARQQETEPGQYDIDIHTAVS